jgi:5'-nucleotidase
MKLLVTNDDGVRAHGINVLAQAMVELGHEVVVAAPDGERSGAGAAVGPSDLDGEGVRVTRVELPGLEGVPAHAVDAHPALIVLLARLGGFGGEPDVVVSGINPGTNSGRAVLHSGTVGAALTAANFQIPAVAVSLKLGQPMHWETAALAAQAAVEWMVDTGARVVLNVNAPDRPIDDIEGVRWAELARFGTVRTAIKNTTDERLQIEFRATDDEVDPETDTALVSQGFVTITTLVGVRAGDDPTVADAIGDRLSRRRPRA